jgi:hypothetical protein
MKTTDRTEYTESELDERRLKDILKMSADHASQSLSFRVFCVFRGFPFFLPG